MKDDIWVATSKEISGLILESQAVSQFLSDILEVSVEVLKHNRGITEEELHKTRLHYQVTHESEQSASTTGLTPESRIVELQLTVAV